MPGTKSAYAAGDAFGSRYLTCASLLTLTLVSYPLASYLASLPSTSEYALSPTAELAAYGVLDVVAQPLFLFFFLHQLNKIDSGSICGTIALQGGDEDAASVTLSVEDLPSRRIGRYRRNGRY